MVDAYKRGRILLVRGARLILEPLAETPADSVRTSIRRRVFFVAGFDPRGVNGYYQRFSEALAPFAEVGPLDRPGLYETRWRWRGAAADVAFSFLHWDDIVDQHWRGKGRIGAQIAAVRALLVYQRSGLLTRARDGARAVRWALLILGLAPAVSIAAALLLTLAVGAIGAEWLPYGGWLALPALVGALYLCDRAWRRLNLEWLAKGFACIVETALGEKPNWDERCAGFAETIAEAARDGEADEIVVIGHSLGAILAMRAIAGYLELGVASKRPIVLMTLGNIIPFYTWIEPERRAMREGEKVATSREVAWIDVTSGSDPASACRMGPLVGADAQAPRWEPEFHRILTPERFRYIRRRPLDYHFQYLKPADLTDGFDLIRMLCSPSPFLAQAPR